GGSLAGQNMRVNGRNGGAAKANLAVGVGITVTGSHGTVDVDTGDVVGGGFLKILGGDLAGHRVDVTGSSGAASFGPDAGVHIAAQGAVAIATQGDGSVSIGALGSAGLDGKTKAHGTGGKATANFSNAVAISGGTLSVTDAGSGPLDIRGGMRSNTGARGAA